ncbi:hypothetical protein C8A01DRAFT_11922 [Parachaetomium inaequale]|uniref:ADF-H domain-containing protein n=1 Tax=Parachaetomium inaequale TaxID=2588326 RepID=A0AAN6PP57_9PEZI|nr:hypothetical protein C8A01DRAFT_11922 [Parachaetomium inaequale]
MSLNGLDDARVKEAHEAAVAEPGGWFLLKYASRDEVELLGRGSGGIVEIRNNIAQYTDKSPLYGFLRYRRRNVIIKYLPEDCSRLIQGTSFRRFAARVTVHFEAVCDRFSPHDTTFSISDPKELKDTKLSAACSLHAASGSTSSSTSSLRRRRLMEIAEEEEEEERERKRQSVVKEEEHPKPSTAHSEPPVKLDAELAKSPEASRFANELEPPNFTGAPRPSSPAKSFDESSRRMSSQSSRTDLYPTTSYPYSKPRVKLGPRPSADPAGRPRSSAGGPTHRVSTVPAGLKSMSKGSRKGRSRSDSQDEEVPESPIQEQAVHIFPPIEVVGADAKPSETESAQPEISSAAEAPVDTMPPHKITMPATAQPPTKQNTMTPEKARLLKAMKLREKKKMMSLQPTLDVPGTDIPSAPSTPGLPEDKQDPEAVEDAPLAEEAPNDDEGQQEEALATKSDSGIDVGTDHASVDTAMDSHPPSPAATSEIGDSTQASSLSDSTDETILAKDEHPDREREQGGLDDEKPASPAQSEAPLSEEHIDETKSGLHDRQSQATLTPPIDDGTSKEEVPAAPEGETDKTEEPAILDAPASDAVPASPPAPALSDAPVQPSTPEKDTVEVTPEPAEAPEPIVASEPSEVPEPASEQPETKPDAETTGQENAPPAQIRIPVSKFSTQETKLPTSATTQGLPSVVAHASDVDSWRVGESAPPVPEKDSVTGTAVAAEAADMDSKRRELPERIQTDFDAPDNDKRRSVISMLDNDGLMDELQSATVQQATPITVSKSPISPFFGLDQASKRPGGGPDNPRFARTVSNPVRNSFLAPSELPSAPARSASSGAAYLQKGSQQQASDVRPKSSKLGSSISQRIKALEKLSGSTPVVEAATTKERPATTFFAVRKTSTRETSRPSSVADGASLLTRGASPSPPASRDSSPETTRNMGRGRSGSLVNRLSMFEGGMPPRGRPESVQVTARIVRDPSQPFPKGPESKGSSTEYASLDLRQSPLVVDVQNRIDSRSPVRAPSVMSTRTLEREIADQAKQSLLERRLSKQSRDGDRDATKAEATDGPRPRRRSSLSVVKDFIKDRTESIIGAKSPSTDNLSNPLSSAPTTMAPPALSRPSSRAPSVHQPGSLVRRLSVSSRRSSIEQSNAAPSAAVLSPAGGGESETEAKEKRSGSGSSGPGSPNKGGRASRFMRRLSNTLVTGRKNAATPISPTVAEENAAEVEAASRGSTATGTVPQSPPSIVAFMGDVNVQFPDNLLWKRRSICLDNQGFLILSAVQGTAMMPTTIPGKDRHGAMIKRYHMSDFKPPYAPDVELQELPNSVVLDLVDGSGLQIACEDRAGQMSILRILEEAHHNHSNF